MAVPITIEVEDARVLAVLQRISAGIADPKELLVQWGEDLVDSTEQRFATSTAPDGTPWAPNTEATYLAYLDRFSVKKDDEGNRIGRKKGYINQGGRVSALSSTKLMNKRPLIGEGEALSTRIFYRIDGDTLFVGSPEKYAAMQQFGGSKSEFPNLWGDIPARPFLGISDADAERMEETALDYLDGLASG